MLSSCSSGPGPSTSMHAHCADSALIATLIWVSLHMHVRMYARLHSLTVVYMYECALYLGNSLDLRANTHTYTHTHTHTHRHLKSDEASLEYLQ